MPLVMVLDGSPIVPRGIGRVKLIAQDSGDRIFVEQAGAIALAAGAIARCVQLVGNLIRLDAFHAQFTNHAQPRELIGIVLRRRLWPRGAIAKGNSTGKSTENELKKVVMNIHFSFCEG